jgi:hypothetical protein
MIRNASSNRPSPVESLVAERLDLLELAGPEHECCLSFGRPGQGEHGLKQFGRTPSDGVSADGQTQLRGPGGRAKAARMKASA